MSIGHIRQRSAGSWEIRVALPRDHTGARRTRTETIRGARRDAQRRLREILSEIDKGVVVDAGKLTVGAWLEQWLAETAHTTAPKTHQERAAYVRLHLVPALGAIPLARLTPVAIQSYLTAALTSGRLDGKGGLSAPTVAHHERVLHTALERARRLKLIATNPCDDVDAPRVERAPIITWTPEQQAALLVAASGSDLYVPLYLALATGLRRGELLGLAWSNVGMDTGLLRVVQVVEQTKTGSRIKPAPKTRRSRRTVALTPSTVAVLRQHKVAQAEEHLRLGRGKPDLLFPKWAAGPAQFGTAFSRMAARIGITASIHDARHTHCTALLEAGVHPKIVSERLGHSSVAFTLDRYGHVTPTMNAAAVAMIEAVLPATAG